MEKFIFTFKENHPLRNYVQPVFAEEPKKARVLMEKRYGNQWGFQWTGSQWEEWIDDLQKMKLSVPDGLNPMYYREEGICK